MINKNKLIFYKGIEEGMKIFAHWKDGTQYVGTTGETLTQAIINLYAGKYDDIINLPRKETMLEVKR